MKIAELVNQRAVPAAERQGCFVWDVEYVREAGQRYLRVYIDNEDARVDVAQCEAVAQELNQWLDEADPIEEPYIFEVCSAGAERVLKRPSDFQRFLGSEVTVKLYSPKDGRKEHSGVLTAHRDGAVELDGDRLFQKAEVAQVRLRVTF